MHAASDASLYNVSKYIINNAAGWQVHAATAACCIMPASTLLFINNAVGWHVHAATAASLYNVGKYISST